MEPLVRIKLLRHLFFIETFILVCEALYGTISDGKYCEYKLLSF